MFQECKVLLKERSTMMTVAGWNDKYHKKQRDPQGNLAHFFVKWPPISYFLFFM